jgi:hypothetical protein
MKTITLVAALLSTGVLLSGCASNNYQTAQGGTPPLVPVNLATVQPPVVIVLHTIITCDGPGSWTQEGLWDEYVVTIANQGTQPLTIASAALTDLAGTSHAASARVGALEKESEALEQKYHDAGVAFVRNAGAGAVTVGGGVRLVGVAGGALGAGVGLAAAVAVVPVPFDYVRKIDKSNNRDSIVAEFTRRRLALPLTLAPGETRIGSFFFPMVPNPRSLSLPWSSGTSGGELTLPLESVHGLHVQVPAPAVIAPRP